MSFSVNQSAADTTTTITQAVPVQRLPNGTKAQVMEVLKVGYLTTQLPAIASATEATDTISIFLSTASFGTTDTNYAEPRVFDGLHQAQTGAFTAAGTYVRLGTQFPVLHDLTDGAGHGVLVATDNIYAQVQSVGTGIAIAGRIKILYRWKNIGLSEYIGIVSSQQ